MTYFNSLLAEHFSLSLIVNYIIHDGSTSEYFVYF